MRKTIKQKEFEEYKSKLMWNKLHFEIEFDKLKSKIEVVKQEIQKYDLLIKGEESKTK